MAGIGSGCGTICFGVVGDTQLHRLSGRDLYYGKKKNISPIQNIYCQVWEKSMNHALSNYPKEIITPIFEDLLSKMEKEIDKVMPIPESPDYNKYVAMKTYTYAFRACPFEKLDVKVDYLDTAYKLIKPIKLEKEGLFLFLSVSQRLANYYLEQSDHLTALMYLKEAEKAFEEFKAKFPNVDDVAMVEYDLFDVKKGCKFVRPGEYCTSYYSSIIINLFCCYYVIKDVSMQLKYVIPSIKERMNNKDDPKDEIFAMVVIRMRQEITCLITSRYFAQVNHLLAGLMLKLVKDRRTSSDDQKPIIKYAQSDISEYYALWAVELLEYSLKVFKDKAYAEKYPINKQVHIYPELIQEGIKTYENQFPCEPILDREDFEESLKMGKNWCLRANQLGKDSANVSVKGIMNRLDQLEKTLKKMKNFK